VQHDWNLMTAYGPFANASLSAAGQLDPDRSGAARHSDDLEAIPAPARGIDLHGIVLEVSNGLDAG
jgi:hypothetical protein